MYYIGVDLGGTNIKAAVTDERGRVIAEGSRRTALPRPAERVADDMLLAARDAAKAAGLRDADISGVGIGCPGVVAERGYVPYSNNLDWKDFALGEYFAARSPWGFPAVDNDANVAALAETLSPEGVAHGARVALIITLGTGLGSGVVIDGKILRGCEVGHMVLNEHGPVCNCGRRGCFEYYSSATGLIRMTREVAEREPNGVLARMTRERGRIDGRAAFDAMRRGDAAGGAVVDEYIGHLACGLANLVNIFRPDIIGLSGGLSNEGEFILAPLRKLVAPQLFGGGEVRIERCALGAKAGVAGAALLAREAAKTS
ncbi:glucokinase [Clostridia bacterium]|nr:glucokinase [Clostridia bacterium]